MEHHEEVPYYEWDPRCDNICEREDLVAKILELVDIMKVVVIRATPQAGKTTLLHLIGRYVLQRRRELEPVFFQWRNRRERDDFPYRKYLEQEKSHWQEKNAEYRPPNPGAKTLYLIDEGQRSYEEVDFWGRDLKNRGTRGQPMFVVVCLYGADVAIDRVAEVESLSLKLSAVQRVELRPSRTNNPYILFKLEETTIMVQKWAIYYRYELTNDIYEYLHTATGGHPGMMGFVLQHFQYCVSKV